MTLCITSSVWEIGEEYELTRHNAADCLLEFIKKREMDKPEFDKKLKALVVKK